MGKNTKFGTGTGNFGTGTAMHAHLLRSDYRELRNSVVNRDRVV